MQVKAARWACRSSKPLAGRQVLRVAQCIALHALHPCSQMLHLFLPAGVPPAMPCQLYSQAALTAHSALSLLTCPPTLPYKRTVCTRCTLWPA